MLQVGTLMLLLRRPLHRTRSILLAVALGAAILGGLTLAWSAVDGSVRPKVALSAPTSPRNTAPAESREFVDRLLSQVEALKSEVRELTEAQQQPAHAIAAIEAEQEFAPSAARILVLRPRCAVVRARDQT